MTILHKIHYSIEVLKQNKNKNRIIGFQNIIGFFIITLWVSLVIHNRKWRKSRERSCRNFPALFSLVVQNVPLLFIIRFTDSDYSFGIFWSLCCLSFDLRLLIGRSVSFSFPCKGIFCTTEVRKKRGKITSLPVTWLTSLLVMGHFRSRDWPHFRS